MVNGLGEMVVEGVEEEFFGLLRNALVFDQGVGDVVRGHSVKQEFVVRCILGFVLRALEIIADEVPESVADQGIEVKQIDDVLKLISRLCLRLQEVHARDNVFLQPIKIKSQGYGLNSKSN